MDDPLTDDALTGGFRLWQRKRGHRYSLDDVLTAWEAARWALEAAAAGRPVRRACDLGCGIGSVLLMLAYKLPEARFEAIEAQEISFGLAQRNVARNGCGERIRLHQGDLRCSGIQTRLGGGFDLVTGTPPYMPPGTSTPSPDPQRAYARVELRGGVEDYLAAAGQLVAPNGRVVVCCDARTPARAVEGGRRAGLRPLRKRDAVPRAGRAPLFTVWTFAREDDVAAGARSDVLPFVARDEDGQRSEAYFAVRAFFDLPRTHGGAPSAAAGERA
ncbi:MAG TPA: methyltransferase [Polyangiaceae bacterium LLY-WYZ-15_(1-7)]|nr:methyltransferase [Polyangiaceae bacterium LLY-WYZ-15_(1-7)]HJL12205.1 methyltransferase [Polyangiaceae bacterium LLY-WYZ-15_(1-7)]HJL23923.1 methyltransferase [Polyangiaceae bacterium LLY-WYZ-15_(1-7)]HJL38454.1 methyltransferase [Polyangiaceae bacterium LLY-WYZ-15_(1-7)]